MTTKKELPDAAHRTVDRRKWMSWVGKSAVLSLAGGVLSRCTAGAENNSMGKDTGEIDAGWGDAGNTLLDGGATEQSLLCSPDEVNFPYEPVDLKTALGDIWPVRTVDPQSLERILNEWRLQVDGMVDTPRTFTFADLLTLPRQDEVVDFHCVEGWSVLDVPWNGVHIDTFIDLVKPQSGVTHVTFHTIDGAYNESLPIDVAREAKTLLAYGVDCNTIPLAHGFPLRLVVPRLLAYKSAKYVVRMEFTDHPIEGYWVALGYPYDGEVPASRLREGKY